ncbi:hypothetical protein R1sor_007894 [Riccia sorocarpa]|uniref:CCHC-type domain-containing protein n=1 Tax=Riccia sorocarpa TaxID=122646 RepID=A0ABD3HS15_9MARC
MGVAPRKDTATSPSRTAIDYISAVSPAKVQGSVRNLMHGYQSVGQMGPGFNSLQGYPLSTEDLMDNEAFEAYDNDVYGSHSQSTAIRGPSWDEQQRNLMLQGMMDLKGEDDDLPNVGTHGTPLNVQHSGGQQLGGGPAGAQSTGGNEHLEDIQEEEEGAFEDAGEEEETPEESYIDRHRAWIDVLDENLQKTRKDAAEKEVSSDFEMDMGELLSAVDDIIEVINICQLDPYCFHITVDSGKARAHIFANSPLKMGTRMVFPLPWDTKFSTRDLKSRAVPVWLELNNVHPGLMNFGLNMLRKIGPIIYAAKNVETQRVNIIRGCVLMDLSKPLPEFIPIAVPEAPEKVMKQRIKYLRLPDACFSCRQRGHFARACLLNQNREEAVGRGLGPNTGRRANGGPTPGQRRPGEGTGPGPERRNGGIPPAGENPTEGKQVEFQTVRRRGKPRFQAPEIKKSMRVDNRYGILAEPTEEHELTEEPKTKVDNWEIRTTKAIPQGGVAKTAAENGNASSSSCALNGNGSSRQVNNMIIREMIDLTQTKVSQQGMEENGTKTSGAKHQQEDRDRRLSSAGAITPTDTSGRKKQNIGETGTEEAGSGPRIVMPQSSGGRSQGMTSLATPSTGVN